MFAIQFGAIRATSVHFHISSKPRQFSDPEMSNPFDDQQIYIYVFLTTCKK